MPLTENGTFSVIRQLVDLKVTVTRLTGLVTVFVLADSMKVSESQRVSHCKTHAELCPAFSGEPVDAARHARHPVIICGACK